MTIVTNDLLVSVTNDLPVFAQRIVTGVGDGLDPIIVYWHDVAEWSGYVTITCYGQAWTAYFGAMGGRTIREFFSDADVGYLTNKLGITPLLRRRKSDLIYLSRIIRAIKSTLPAREVGA
jgi:hypothetical protein